MLTSYTSTRETGVCDVPIDGGGAYIGGRQRRVGVAVEVRCAFDTGRHFGGSVRRLRVIRKGR